MLDLALHTGGYIPVREIASRQGISDKYLEQIVARLQSAGYVRSVRGAGGGYQLTGPAGRYTVGEILRLMEGDLSPADCVENTACPRAGYCVTKDVFTEIKQAIDNVVDNITLADLAERHRNRQPTDYSI